MEKYDYISELAENTAFEIVQNQEEWKKYLTTAARLYKYPFREQLLIYAQRPDATACASIEIWNERMHCWVKKGAKGIALLDDADRGKKLKYVFDVADVYAAKQTGRYPQTWKLYPEHEASVLNHLEQIYGATDPQNSFEERVVEIVERISAEHADQLLGSLQHTIAGSPLADLDETSLDLHLKNTLSESVSFTILSACGIEVQKYSSKFEFSYIHEFDTMDTLSILGDAANELAKPVLLEISKTVRAYEKLRFQKKEIENASHPEYNTLKRESEANNQQTAERGNNDESELREKWRLHDSDVEGQRSTGRDSNEVRNDAGNLSQGESERNLFSYAPEGDVERTSVNDPEPGRRTDGDFDPADGKERWSNRTAQGTGSDDLGETNEQYKESGRGDRAERTDLHAVEYSMARESTLNSHYTNPVIIRQMYHSLRKMGFVKGNVLEPSMGIGNFFGMLPDSMRESNLYGVELDDISGRIAKQLYPQADIQINGFEKTDYPNDFFDLAIGNVPFGQYKVFDRAYDKHNFLIHDYFFAKTLDKVRIGGIIAYITSKGTMDKANPDVRRYIAQRADLLGAVRLPNTAFRSNAGTEVTSDILFFQKRDRLVNQDPDWVYLQEDPNGITMNSYFVEHPEQIVGKMEMISGPYGMESACVPDNTVPFEEQLENALDHITGQIDTIDMMDDLPTEQIIPADPTVKNFSYAVLDQQVYYRENSVMKMVDASEKATERIVGMIAIRNCTQELIDMQLNESSDAAIKAKQSILNQMYDTFTQKYGFINSGPNKRAFSQDSSYFLLCSLEKFDDNGNFKGKADMFTKRTIKKAEVVTSVDTSSEALTISLSEKGKIDLPFMSKLVGKDTDTLVNELTGIIFKNPENDLWETADHYLSGNVREKLSVVKTLVEIQPKYAPNVKALTQVQPKELDASEIKVCIGATWIAPKYINDFLRDIFLTPKNLLSNDIINVQYSNVTGTWNIKGKNLDFGNVLVNMTYGTNRVNAYKLLEDALNLKDTRVYDTIDDKRVLNKKETMIAGQKQESIREAFRDWVFRDPQRRQELVTTYNERFNAIRPREYDGSHLKFPGMTPDIQLKPYQKNAVAHVLYGNNTLLAHCVGAGKTFEMVAAAMESKRLGLCQKSLFVVPNHLIEQWASDFLRLYPGANILAATKKDFEPDKRKKFCSRIATGEYDAVIIGHSQFEKIPLSQERQKAAIEKQINDIEMAIKQARESNGEYFSVKQMERSKKTLQVRLDKLNDPNRKDDVVTFEQLGIDRLFVDESHNYKNLFLYTKMRNVAGISQSEAKKSSDMFAKCQYLDEITGSKGVIFATGTPISNSMTVRP